VARLWTAGAEVDDFKVEGITLAVTTSTGTVRTGTRSFSPTSGQAPTFSFTGATARSYFFRAYINIESNVGGLTTIMSLSASGAGFNARLDASRLLSLYTQAGVQIGSASAALTIGQWYRVELRMKVGTGATDEAELLLDGVQVAVSTTQNVTDSAPTSAILNNGGGSTIYYDDLALNDDQGASQNTWPGDGKVVLLLPISDNARAAKWTGGIGGTTNLFAAVDNTPPVGKLSASATDTTQIEHAGSAAGTTDAYDANMTTYTTAGIAAGDTINTIHFIEADGEDIATGTKLLNFEVLSNPVIASPGNVTAGSDVGACGTYPTNWTVHASPPVYNPSVTVGTSPVMRARRPETASRVASVCFMGMYVDFTPVAIVAAIPHSWIPLLGPILAQ
jgi:hypothetical protein